MKNINVLALGGNVGLLSIKQELSVNHNTNITRGSMEDVIMMFTGENQQILWKNKDIKTYDFVWITTSWKSRQLAYAVSLYLTNNNVPHIKVEPEDTKLVDIVKLAINKIRIPKTMYMHVSKIEENLELINKFCGLPFVIKVTRGLGGNGVYIVKHKSELKAVLEQINQEKMFLIQEFIPNSFDYRVLTSKSEVVSVDKRVRQDEGEFRNNVHCGATETFMNIEDTDTDIIKISQKSSDTLNLGWCGVDVVVSDSDGLPYILEVNRAPGLTPESTETSAALDHVVNTLTERGLIVEQS